MDKAIFDEKKAQSILAGIRESIAKLTVADIQLIAAAQLDRLESWRCTLYIRPTQLKRSQNSPGN